MRNKWLFLGIVVLPILIMIGVNETAPRASHDWEVSSCTRYCHDQKCSHGDAFKQEHPIFSAWYQENMRILKHNPFGLSYEAANIGLYVILVPLFSLFLLWGLIRKRNK